jgi:hypothetical protein
LSPNSFQTARSIFQLLQQEFGGVELGRNSLIRAKLVEALMLFIRSHNGMLRPQAPRPPEKKKDTWKLIQTLGGMQPHA